MSVSRRHRLFTHLLVFSRLLPPMQMARILVSVRLIVRCGFALMRPFRLTAKIIVNGATHGVPISHAQAGTPLSFLTFSLIVNRLPSSWISRPVGLLALLFILISAADVRPRGSKILSYDEIKVVAPSVRRYSVRIGGSALSSLKYLPTDVDLVKKVR